MELNNKPEYITSFSPEHSENKRSPKTFIIAFLGLAVAGTVFYLYLLSNASPEGLLNPLGKPFGGGNTKQNLLEAPLTCILVSKEKAEG